MPDLIYLATPYSHADARVVEYRFIVACRVAGRLMGEGHLVFSPIAHTHPIAMEAKLPLGWDFWARYDQALLDRATEVWVLRMDGWDESRGIQAEVRYAQETDKPVRFIDPLPDDLRN